MRRFFIFLTTFLLLFGATSFANEAVLIDFSQLAADFPADNPTENARTMIDFSAQAGTSFSDAERALMRTSLALNNWEVRLAPSARRIMNQSLTMAREVPVLETARRFPGDRVLGVRVNFPNEPFNSWASIRPPFEIPAYMRRATIDDQGNIIEDETDRHGSRFVDGFGVVKNVGILRTVSMTMYGSNFPHGIEIVLRDHNNRDQVIFMDYMQFEGWRTLTWRNPNYISDVRQRALRPTPLYPRASPHVKLIGLNIRKDAMQEGGDVIAYIRDISITFDRAVNEFQRDIDEEAVWGIMTAREEARRTHEFRRLGTIQVLRYLESQLMHPDM
ncbi:MAG: flagellar filament outer layer protein FlaA [Spirochaetes bacterium]|nr:flagellar filament outer layer protein FlaA [Spirochaetota bacterium]